MKKMTKIASDREFIESQIEELENQLIELGEDEVMTQLRKDIKKMAKMLKMLQEEFENEGLDKDLAIRVLESQAKRSVFE